MRNDTAEKQNADKINALIAAGERLTIMGTCGECVVTSYSNALSLALVTRPDGVASWFLVTACSVLDGNGHREASRELRQ